MRKYPKSRLELKENAGKFHGKTRKSVFHVFPFWLRRKQSKVKSSSRIEDLESGDGGGKEQFCTEKNCREEKYYFDHGQENFYRTIDHLPELKTDKISQQLYLRFSKFWAEVFGLVNVFVACFVTFFIQLYRSVIFPVHY